MSLMTLRASASMSTHADGRDFAGDDRGAGLHHRFAGHAGALVLREDRVEDGVGDLVGDLVGWPSETDSEVKR
jgi:hypothetical protein